MGRRHLPAVLLQISLPDLHNSDGGSRSKVLLAGMAPERPEMEELLLAFVALCYYRIARFGCVLGCGHWVDAETKRERDRKTKGSWSNCSPCISSPRQRWSRCAALLLRSHKCERRADGGPTSGLVVLPIWTRAKRPRIRNPRAGNSNSAALAAAGTQPQPFCTFCLLPSAKRIDWPAATLTSQSHLLLAGCSGIY